MQGVDVPLWVRHTDARKTVGPQIASRTFPMMLPSGENILAEERFFIINADKSDIDRSGWSNHEKQLCAIATGGA